MCMCTPCLSLLLSCGDLDQQSQGWMATERPLLLLLALTAGDRFFLTAGDSCERLQAEG